MLILVTYDVSTKTAEGRRRLSRVARACLDFGQRVQHSVFECEVDTDTLARLRIRLLDAYDPSSDSLRFYFLGSAKRHRVKHHGTKPSTDLSGPLIV